MEKQAQSSLNSSLTIYPGATLCEVLHRATHTAVTKTMHHLTLSRDFLAFLWTPYTALSTAVKATQESESVSILRNTCSLGEYVSAPGVRET